MFPELKRLLRKISHKFLALKYPDNLYTTQLYTIVLKQKKKRKTHRWSFHPYNVFRATFSRYKNSTEGLIPRPGFEPALRCTCAYTIMERLV